MFINSVLIIINMILSKFKNHDKMEQIKFLSSMYKAYIYFLTLHGLGHSNGSVLCVCFV